MSLPRVTIFHAPYNTLKVTYRGLLTITNVEKPGGIKNTLN